MNISASPKSTETSSDTCPVACPDDYDYIFRTYRRFLFGVVFNAGVPHYAVEDATGAILTRMMAQDGLASYEGDIRADRPARVKAYLASYFCLGARAELTRIYTHHNRSVALDSVRELETLPSPEEPRQPDQRSDLLDHLTTGVSGDAQVFIQRASEHPTYAKARASLVADGWDSNRIRRAVREARAYVRSYLCSTQ